MYHTLHLWGRNMHEKKGSFVFRFYCHWISSLSEKHWCCAKDRFSEDTDFNQFQCIWDVTIVNRDPLYSVIQFAQVHRPEQNHAMLLLIRITRIFSVKCLAFEAFVHLSQVTFVCLMKHRCERGRFRKTAFHRQELSPKFQGRGILRFFHDLKNINHSRGNHI